METAAAAALPDDLLAGVFGRLPARSLAASRGTCKSWRDLIDERQLLLRLRRLLPHTVGDLFINHLDDDRSHFLCWRALTSSPEHDRSCLIHGKFDFIQGERRDSLQQVVDHCNGLILLVESFLASNGGEVLHVCNPATQWSARLPPCPAEIAFAYTASKWGCRAFLVFDPFVSMEYKVLLSPAEPEVEKHNACRLMEWPPSAWTAWHEFSSSTGRWEEKVFVREGEAAGGRRRRSSGKVRWEEKVLAGDLLLYGNHWPHLEEPQCRYAAYWKGALYVHCRGEFVSRLSLLDGKYRVIKSPLDLAECKNDGVRSFLGKSEKGVYIAAISSKGLPMFRVWTLSESGGDIELVPKDQSDLVIDTWSRSLENNELDGQKYWKFVLADRSKSQHVSLVQQNVNIVGVSNDEEDYLPFVKFLGFHPYKEVIFMGSSKGHAVAFHLNSQKVQYFSGIAHLAGKYNFGVRESFVYTPCLLGDY